MFLTFYDEGTEEMELLLDERNKKWIPKIETMAKDQSVFFGVGAGHLGGEDGVLNLLKQAGYRLTPIYD